MEHDKPVQEQIRTPQRNEREWFRGTQFGAAVLAVAASLLTFGCGRNESEWQAYADTLDTPTPRQVLDNPGQYEGKTIRIEIAPEFRTDHSSLSINSKYKYGSDYVNVELEYSLIDQESLVVLPAFLMSRPRLMTGVYTPDEIALVSANYRLPGNTTGVVGEIKFFEGTTIPYLSIQHALTNGQANQ
ncbi:MAG: hypothetical protein KDD64_02410 [Bdellovibrionales bacterium]|nr:hypothetical protein [Bdellovibrionales bacterium]